MKGADQVAAQRRQGQEPCRRCLIGEKMDHAAKALADWLNGATPENSSPPGAIWACVEIFGHRKHYGRVSEVEKFGTKMLRIDVAGTSAAPLLGQPEAFETFIYGGGSIFSLTPMTEEACRKWADYERPKPYNAVARLPAPDYEDADSDTRF